MAEAAARGRFDWSRLSKQQLGRYAEYFVKMELTLWGFDVYTAEVDDKGIDFVVRREDRFLEVQVKSIREKGYVFMRKEHFRPREGLYAAVVIFTAGRPPDAYFVPSTAWLEPDGFFVSRDYEGKKSAPEWGLNLSRANLARLEPFALERRAALL